MIPVPAISSLDAAFGTTRFLPPMIDIPKEFHDPGTGEAAREWLDLVQRWFFFGLKSATFIPREGVDTAQALRAVKCVLASMEPAHEHKISGAAYLLSQWFERVDTTETNTKEELSNA